MSKMIAAAAAALSFGLMAAPAQAQDAPVNGVVTIFGEDRCPADAICVRAPESDRFRIPPEIRAQAPIAPRNESWAVRQETALTTGATGTGSCSAVGANGASGCFVKEATAAMADARARRKAETDLPLP